MSIIYSKTKIKDEVIVHDDEYYYRIIRNNIIYYRKKLNITQQELLMQWGLILLNSLVKNKLA